VIGRQTVSSGSPCEPIVGISRAVRIEDWRAVAEVHGRYFRDIRPVNTIVQVAHFIDPDWLLETHVDAVVGGA